MKTESKMGTLGLTASLIGVTIGAGVVTLIGQSAGVTGGSTWLAYLVAIFFGFLTVIPFGLIVSTLVVKGGNYSAILHLVNKKIAGIYVCSSILMALNWATFAVGLANYLKDFIPVNPTILAAASILLFYVLNLFGISLFAKVQGAMTFLLVAMLLFFGVSGLPRLDSAIFNFSDANFLTGGSNGFFTAVGMLLYSTVAYQLALNFSSKTKNPRKTAPKAMILCVVALIVVYELVTFTATGVLPFDQVINANLTATAKAMWSAPMVMAFVFFGPIMALATTLNGNIASFAIPIQNAASDGWFPKVFKKTNRFGAPWVVYTIGMAIALLPVVLGIDFPTIIRNMVVIYNITGLFIFIAACFLPKKFPEAWKKSTLYMPTPVFCIVMAISLIATVIALYLVLRNINGTVILVTVVAYLIIGAYAMYREKKGYVNIDMSKLSVETDEE